MDRPYKTVRDPMGNDLKVPTTSEHGDWIAQCSCGRICGGTFGVVPNSDDRRYTACPCGNSGEPGIVWKPIITTPVAVEGRDAI